MAGSNLSDQNEPITEIIVVPLVDIILVVLIIFMVTAPLVLRPTVNINLPEASSGEQNQSVKNMEVIIDERSRIFLDGQEMSLNQLEQSIKEHIQHSRDASVILTADKNVTLNSLTPVIDAIKNSGIRKVGFSVEKK